MAPEAAARTTTPSIRSRNDGTINDGDLSFYTTNNGSQASRMTILSDGKVGIGTTTPSTLLHVSGGNLNVDRGVSTSVSRKLVIGGAQSATGAAYAKLHFVNYDIDGDKVDYVGAAIRSKNNGNTDDGDLNFYTAQDGVLTQRMIIAPDGDIGIGTLSPAQDLHIKDNAGNAVLKIEANGFARLELDSNGSGPAATVTQAAGLNDLRFTTNNAARIVIQQGGNVGIGTANPNSRLHVSGGDLHVSGGNLQVDRGGATNGVTRQLTIGGARSGNGNDYAVLEFKNWDDDTNPPTNYVGASIRSRNDGGSNDGDLSFYTFTNGNLASRMTIRSDGNVGIGTTTPDGALHIRRQTTTAGAPERMLIIDSHDDPNGFDLTVGSGSGILLKVPYQNDSRVGASIDAVRTSNVELSSATALVFSTSQNDETLDEHMRIDENGKVGIGTTTPNVKLDVVGSINYTGTITDVSDERLKENIEPVLDGLSKVLQLHGVTFNMIDNPDVREVGLIAQDVQKVLPEAVSVIDEENGYLGVSYPSLIGLLVEAIKEQQSQIETLNARIAGLEEQLVRTNNRVSSK